MSNSEKRVFLIPRWKGNINSDWYFWLKNELSKSEDIKIARLEMPNWSNPNIKETIKFLRNIISLEDLHENTFFVGHSLGCQAILRYLETLFERMGTKIGGTLFVGGWFTLNQNWEELLPWMDQNMNYKILKESINKRIMMISEDDPYVNCHKNVDLWRKYLNPEINILKNKGHFHDMEQMEVLLQAKTLLGIN